MNKNDLFALTAEQLGRDLNCDGALFAAGKNTAVEWADVPGRRVYQKTPFLQAVVFRQTAVFSADRALLPELQALCGRLSAEWLFSAEHLRALDALLLPHGQAVGSFHHYYLPDLDFPAAAPLMPVKWYEGDEIEAFRGDDRWDEALAFQPTHPDILAVAALDKHGEPVAMAGISRDSETLWQIGINVTPDFRGRGLGANLTALLKQEALRRGAVPFYGTSESHIYSQNTALRAGFRPAWAQLWSQARA